MGEMISRKCFRDFYMTASVEVDTVYKYFDIMREAILHIADGMSLGMFIMIVNSPANSLDLEGIQDRADIYLNPLGFNPEGGVRQTFVTNDWGIVQMELYPKQGFFWQDEDEEELEFLFQTIFDLTSKACSSIVTKRIAITDSLTGCANAQGVAEYVTKLKDDGRLTDYDALCFSVKNFRYIKKRVGNRQSDKVLKDYSSSIREFMKQGELFGRIGGDTFCLLLEKDRTLEGVKFISTRRVLIETEKKNIEFDLPIRLGIYRIKPGDDYNRLFEATQAAYNYTRNPSSSDIVWFDERMLQTTVHDQEVSGAFKNAIKKEEFVVYYQPKVDLSTGKLISAEALCRWIKDGELVPPMEFIPVLEREGTICDLDFYMLNKVCENIKEWQSRDIEPVKVSVNFSRAHVLNQKLAEKIIKVVNNHKVNHRFIEVEITEMSGYEDIETLSEFVDSMKEYGIETSIDDFGTGYSSLTMIKDLNVDYIKLDKSFLEKITSEESTDQSVVRNIINMVNELNMKVVAEGVETEAQKEFLKAANCQVGQGFLFDHPLPREEFEKRLCSERIY